MPHQPQVLADLVQRLRREPLPRDYYTPPVFSAWVHELTRDEVARAVADGIFEVDRRGSVQALANGRPYLVPSGDAG